MGRLGVGRLDSTLGSFEIVGQLGAGGFGTVYEAIDRRTDHRVAIKELVRSSASALAQFKQEFRALADLHHPNLVGLRGLFEHGERWYIAMELVEGEDFLSYVRGHRAAVDNTNALGFHEQHLRRALYGMAQGLVALHEHGVLHRDLKPSNVRINAAGNAVLLDFGLVTSIDSEAQSTHPLGVGTVLYMAPEQARGGKIGREVDWYAFGSCLFEALTGRVPYEGSSAMRVAFEKQQRPPPAPSSLAGPVPEDLEALCMDLLELDPARRPTGREVLRRLKRGREPESLFPGLGSLGSLGSGPGAAFAGREGELELLERALSRTHEGELRLVLVEGESGVGKSALVEEFLRRTRATSPRLFALKGRCYENEQVAYKAFDGCIDELAKELARMDRGATAALMPSRAALLGQLFPVLRGIPAIAKARVLDASMDPIARRREAFAALSALFARLAEERPLVLVIDDLQWADAESFRLLQALSEGSSPPALLLVATVRPREELEPSILEQLEILRAWKRTDLIQLLGLPRAQAEALARRLLGDGEHERWERVIAAESRGHPLFLSELVQYTRSHDLGAGGSLTLELALRSRIDRLNARARELLELVALAGRPYNPQVFARALSLPNVEESAKLLLSARLLRARGGNELGCFHDRIRHVAVSMIARARLPYLHGLLAHALEETYHVGTIEQARHWDLAGEPERAIHAYEDAGDEALSSLAFVRAEGLYARALELMGDVRNELYRRLTVQRAQALACAGRSAEAATLYAEAADLAQGEQRMRLRSRAAQHLMQSAQWEPGYRAARELLEELGMRLPESTGGALAQVAWTRFCVALRGRTYEPRPSRLDDHDTRLALDIVQEFSAPLTMLAPPIGLALTMQYVRRAIALGDPVHLAKACADEGWSVALRTARKDADRLFETSRKLLTHLNLPASLANCAYLEGASSLIHWDFPRASRCLEEAHHLLQTQCVGEPWLLTNVRMSLGSLWRSVGEHRRLASEGEAWIAEARERRDPYACAMLTGLGFGHLRHLMRDDPERARAELTEVIEAVPREPLTYAHLGEFVGMQQTLQYQGGRAAFEWFKAFDERGAKAFLMKARVGRELSALFRGMAALRACEAATSKERTTLVQIARRSARALRAIDSEFSRPFSALLFAQVYALEGQRERALQVVSAARRGFDRVGYFGGHAAGYLEGLLIGGAQGAEARKRALRAYAEQAWVDPFRGLALAAPAIVLLEEQQAGATQERRRKLIRDRYEVLRPLGSSGFGSVVAARDHSTGRTVALKELVRTSPGALARFKREFRAVQGVHHPNLVRLEALFEDRGAWYIAMELVEGTDLISWVRTRGNLDEQRLYLAFAGLVQAVSALHAAGLVHRDINPSNVRVSDDGRVVLLDFGLVARTHDARDASMVGTAEYVPPEQLEGHEPDRAADVYAIGACLYQALTGELPFQVDTPLKLTELKRRQRPLPPSQLAFGTSQKLEALCMRMLEPHPAARPLLSEVLETLRPEPTAGPVEHVGFCSLVPPESPLQSPFSGREAELEALFDVHASTSEHGVRLVVVEGESGLGKTALVSEFARRLSERTPELLLLSSRCYENEQLAFKAFDGAVDELAVVLRARPQAECEPLLPRRAALLSQLFPVLASVPAIGQAPKKGLSADPSARRIEAFECFAQLLTRLSHERPFLLVIDDLQWADVESFRLLQEVLRAQPAARLMILCTARSESEFEGEAAAGYEELLRAPATTRLRLPRLQDAAAEDLARRLLENVPFQVPIQELAQESKGHPMFVRELVEHAKLGGAKADAGPLTLDRAILGRVERLEPAARELLELVALGGKPYGAHVLSRALVRNVLKTELLTPLLAQGLVRQRREQELACAHDRIRRVVLEVLAPARRRALSACLAGALEEESASDPAERARLWDDAGGAERAIQAYEQAGQRALLGLAFARAERLFARALELLGDTRDERTRDLLVLRGHALARGGQSAEAAEVYRAAGQNTEGELKIRVRVWTAQQLIQSLQLERGLEEASALFAELGVPLPKGESAAIHRILWERVCMSFRGNDLEGHTSKASEGSEQLVLSALHDLMLPLYVMAPFPGSAVTLRYLRRALRCGAPSHLARALGLVCTMRSLREPRADHERLIADSLELAERTHDPAVVAGVGLTIGTARIVQCRFEDARKHMERVHEIVQSQCPGEPWMLTNARMHLGWIWQLTGEHALLSQHLPVWLREARERKDAFAHAILTSYGSASFRHLMRDDPEAALEEIGLAMASWPDQPFAFPHLGAAACSVYAHRYRGGEAALRYLEQARKQLDNRYVRLNPSANLLLTSSRAGAVLEAVAEADTAHAARLLRVARAEARRAGKIPSPLSKGAENACFAVIEALCGQRERALEHARVASAVYGEAGHVQVRAVRYLEGLLEGGDVGREKREATLAFFASQGWRDPRRALAMYLPALHALESSS